MDDGNIEGPTRLRPPAIPPELLQLSKRIKAARESRSEVLDRSLFGEPAWNMMLALYIAAGERYRLTTSALCAESGVPATTALRWIDRLVDRKMLRRIPHPFDNRANYVELTFDTVNKISRLLERVNASYLRAA